MSTAASILASMRPKQWTKNLIVFAPALFGGVLVDADVAIRVSAAFLVLCGVSGAVYLLNDLHDAAADRVYERTRLRPIAAGMLAPRTAAAGALVVVTVSGVAAFALDTDFGLALVAYVVLQIAYTIWLKRLAIVDVLAICAGFVLRAVAGARIADVPDSPWLLVCAALLVSFLAAAKRRQELDDLGVAAPQHRPVLARYTVPALDVLLSALLGATLVSYLAYTMLSATALVHPLMVLTAPPVVYGLFRYLALVFSEDAASAPAEDILFADTGVLAAVLLWLVTVATIVYVA